MITLTDVLKEIWGINRNIVECKLENKIHNSINKYELIETLWNVNPRLHLN